MKSLSKEKRDYLILISLGTVAIVAGLWYGLLTGMKRELRTLKNRISEQQSKVESAQRLISSTAETMDKVDTATASLKINEDQMASGDMYSWIILTVNQFRSERKVDIPQFSREVTGEVGFAPKFPYRAATFTVRGTAFFHDFGNFIADFENAFPFTRIQNLELDASKGSIANAGTHPESLAFRLEIVALINPTSL